MNMSTIAKHPELGILLNLAFGAVKSRLHAKLADAGFDDLGPSFGYAFRVLERNPLSLAELAAQLGMTPQGALKIVDEMVRRSYVERAGDSRDGRVTRLVLTPRGHAVVKEARRFYLGYERQLARRFGARQVAACRAVLEAMVGEAAAEGLERVARPF